LFVDESTTHQTDRRNVSGDRFFVRDLLFLCKECFAMVPCPSCCFPNSEQARLCGHCGIYLKPIGDYVLTERIGTGGFAEVYRAVNRYTGHPVAIKLLHRKLINDKEIEQRFFREVEILQNLRSPNVVQIYGYGELPDMGLYLVMEWLDGQTLDVFLQQQPHKRLAFQQVIPLFTQLLYGLHHIHEKRVVHRDLKPKNFMVVREKDKHVLKILDFGIAWKRGSQELTERGMFVGSTYFMSPEQFKAQKEKFGPSTDLYVAGQLLVWMLTGKHIFTANTLQALAILHCVETPPTLAQLCPDLPFSPQLESLVAKALQKKPDKRYQHAMAFLNAFRQSIPEQMQALKAGTPLQHAATIPSPTHSTSAPLPLMAQEAQLPMEPAQTPHQAPPFFGDPPTTPTPSQRPPQRVGGGGGQRSSQPPQGSVMLLEQVVQVPPLASAPFPSLAAPIPGSIKLASHAPYKQTPMSPLQAISSGVAQHDSSPAPLEDRPLPTFKRNTTSVHSTIPFQKPPKSKRLLWIAIGAGTGLLLAASMLFLRGFTG
jgi:serine/threonine protein kinase